jgi:hypothetical protein
VGERQFNTVKISSCARKWNKVHDYGCTGRTVSALGVRDITDST